jgi:hypothetical protein
MNYFSPRSHRARICTSREQRLTDGLSAALHAVSNLHERQAAGVQPDRFVPPIGRDALPAHRHTLLFEKVQNRSFARP